MGLADICQIFFLLFLLLCPRRGWPLQDGHHPSSTPMKVGVILDSSMLLERKIANCCIRMAVEDFYSNHSSSRSKQLELHLRDYQRGDVVGAASAAIDLLENVGVQVIVGPLASSEVEFIAALGGKARMIPIISFTETSLSPSMADASYFVRAAQSDLYQVEAITDIIKAYDWREAVLIYEDGELSKGMIPPLVEALEEANIKVASRSPLSTDCSHLDIKKELYRLMAMQTRVFIMHMAPSLGIRLFSSAFELGMMSKGYAWIVSTGMGNLLNSLHPSEFDFLQGVLGVKAYIPETKELEDFTARWKRRFHMEYPGLDIPRYLSVSGLWAYDTMWALASALEETKVSRKPDFYRFGRSFNSSTNIIDLAVSPTGPQLLEEILKIKFRGLSGEFELKNGQRKSNTLQIVNVIGRGERVVGFWSPTTAGLSRALNKPQVLEGINGSYSNLSKNLKMVIWPGETAEVPKGWVVPTNGKKLKVVVPIKRRFREYVDVELNQEDGGTTARGYCIDLFEAALELLPYAVPYEYIPFKFPESQRESSGGFDELLRQVSLGEFDVAVADVTILAERSESVDFTFPYTESGLSLLVALKEVNRYSAFVFLKPFSTGLWLTTAAFFLLMAAVIWLLEHKRNPEFRGRPAHHIGLAFYFAFSMLVFAHNTGCKFSRNRCRFLRDSDRKVSQPMKAWLKLFLQNSFSAVAGERLTSNPARFLVIVWSFVVLILTSSYTASLSSILTVQKFQPTVKDIQTLIGKGEYVGYQNGSFVLGILKRLNFDESKLKPYNNIEEYVPALAAGSKNGGVAAVVDETPYLKLFLAKYCQGFAMIGPIFKTGGFGFVVLKVTEGDRMAKLGDAWFGNQTCLDSNAKVDCKVLTFSSFWGLFIIAGTVSFGAVSAFLFSIVTDSRRRIRRADVTKEAEIWKKTTNVKGNCTDATISSVNIDDHRIDDIERKLVTFSETPVTPHSIPIYNEVQTEDETSVNKQAFTCN